MDKHTPGPWSLGRNVIGKMGGAGFLRHIVVLAWDDEQGKADAQLIVTAPELLTVLEDFENWFCGFNPECRHSRQQGREVVIRARAAICRARTIGAGPDDRRAAARREWLLDDGA